MGWQNSYWAGFAVAMISLSTAGQSLNKGTMRMLGTLVAAAASLTLIAWFAQDRWWFIAFLSIYIGFCTYMIAGKKRQYFWYCCAFVCLVICAHAAGQPDAFSIAVLRVQQTGMGILVYTLVSILLWPTDSRGLLKEVTGKLFTAQATIFRSYRSLLGGQGTAGDSRPLRIQEVQLLGQQAQALNAAETDSYEVWELRRQWRHLQQLSTDLLETLERWRHSFSEVQQFDLTKLLPNFEDVLSELDDRFTNIEHLLADETPGETPKPLSAVVDLKEVHARTNFQKAALAVTKTQIDRLETLSRALFDCVLVIKGEGRYNTLPFDSQSTRATIFRLDPDRLQSAVTAMATLWCAFFIWFYIDPPGHATFVEFATILAMGTAMMPLSPIAFFVPFMAMTFFAGGLYIFVMPHLAGYTELGIMIFIAIFAIYYLFWQPRQGLVKSIGAAMLLNVISVQNQQTYSFAGFANSVVMIALACGIAIAIWYLPPSPRPEKVFLRLVARFFRQSELLLSRMDLDWEKKAGIVERLRLKLYQNDILGLGQKLSVAGGQIDQQLFPANTSEQVQRLVNSLGALALRLKDLVDAREYQQARLLMQKLLDDVKAWRIAIEALFKNWSADPTYEPDSDLQNQLAAKLKGMEIRINQTLSQAEKGELREEDYKNFYHLIGSFRGLSESVVEHAKLSAGINWGEWKEARF
jgi:uncharacterized membrane protein YccC